MEDILKTIITVSDIQPILKDGVSIGANLIVEQGDKKLRYALFKTKKDGTETKAYTEWKSCLYSTGSTLGIAYKESKHEFKTVDGETKVGTNRNIAWISKQDDMYKYAPDYSEDTDQTFEDKGMPIDDVMDLLKEKEVDIKDIPF